MQLSAIPSKRSGTGGACFVACTWKCIQAVRVIVNELLCNWRRCLNSCVTTNREGVANRAEGINKYVSHVDQRMKSHEPYQMKREKRNGKKLMIKAKSATKY